MAKVQIRNTEDGRTVPQCTTYNIADVFYNERFTNTVGVEMKILPVSIIPGDTLVCIHWDKPIDAVSSEITVTQPDWREENRIDTELCTTMIHNRKVLETFLKDIHDRLGARLLAVKIQPLVFIFTHTESQLFITQAKLFQTLVKNLVSVCVSKMPSINFHIDEKHSPERCRSLHHVGSKQKSPGRTSGDTYVQTSTNELYIGVNHRLDSIEEEMMKQKKVFKKHSEIQQKQNDELMKLFDRVSEEIRNIGISPKDESQQDVVSQGQYRQTITQFTTSEDDKVTCSTDKYELRKATMTSPPGTEIVVNHTTSNTDSKQIKSSATSAAKKTYNANSGDKPQRQAGSSDPYPQGNATSTRTQGQSWFGEWKQHAVDTARSGRRMPFAVNGDRPQDSREHTHNTTEDTRNSLVPQNLPKKTQQRYRSVPKELTRNSTNSSDSIQFIVDEYVNKEDQDEANFWSGVNKALVEEHDVPRATEGMDTVFCLDTSSSISEENLVKMKEMVSEFIAGIEDIAEGSDIEENMALVTFGGTANVLYHLTNDYGSLRDCLDTITPGGLTPLRQALLVALACLTKGGTLSMGELKILPRIVVITDGRASSIHDKHGQDTSNTSSQEKMALMGVIENIVGDVNMIWIPIGNADVTFLQSMAKLSKGQLVESRNIQTLCNHQRVRRIASTVLKALRGTHTDIDSVQLETMIVAFGANLQTNEKEEVQSLVVEGMYSMDHTNYSSTDKFDNINTEDSLPPLGSRVIRGPDWKWQNQDSHGPGTIINHKKGGGSVYVLWDNGHTNMYRYGNGGAFDVLLDDEHPRQFRSHQIPEIGVQVERGKDWLDSYGNQDGGPGHFGVIIRKSGNKVMVRWGSGAMHEYRLGDDKFDLLMKDPVQCLMETTTRSTEQYRYAGGVRSVSTRYVWQRFEENHGWECYSQPENDKITEEFEKGTKSCLITRKGKSYRIIFQEEIERATDDKKITRIRRVPSVFPKLPKMTNLQFREYRKGKLVSLKTYPTVVDVHVNEELLKAVENNERVRNHEKLFCIHWEQTGDTHYAMTTVLMVTPESSSTCDFHQQLALDLNSAIENLYGFIEQVHETFGWMLMYIVYKPFLCVFERNQGGDLNRMDACRLHEYLHRFMPSLPSDSQIETQFGKLSRTDCNVSLQCFDAHRELFDSPGALYYEDAFPLDQHYENRFRSISRQLSEQRALFQLEFGKHKKENDEIFSSLLKISESLHLLEKDDTSRKYEYTNISDDMIDSSQLDADTMSSERESIESVSTISDEHIHDLSQMEENNKTYPNHTNVKVVMPNQHEDNAKQVESMQSAGSQIPIPLRQSLKWVSDAELRSSVFGSEITISKETRTESVQDTLQHLKEINEDDIDISELVSDVIQEEQHTVPKADSALTTVLCLDNTVSSPEAFRQLKKITTDFVNGIEDIVDKFGLEENIGIVITGPQARVHHPLSNDYGSLRDSIDQIQIDEPGERSCFQVLLVCLAAATKGGVCNIGGYLRVPTRLIFITDGSMINNILPFDAELHLISAVLDYFGTRPIRENVMKPILVVPLRETAKDDMQGFVTKCKGNFLLDITAACNYQATKVMSARIIEYISNHRDTESGNPVNIDRIVSVSTAGFSLKDKCQISDIVRARMNDPGSYLGATDIFDNINIVKDLPCLGSRVNRGPDWHWGLQDSKGLGTVFNHGGDKASLWVLWDCGTKNVYRYGRNDKYDVLLETQPVLKTKGETIEIGMQVELPNEGEEPYRNSATVIRKKVGSILVSWPDGTYEEHDLAENPCPELCVCMQ